jgi:uncharacterized protein
MYYFAGVIGMSMGAGAIVWHLGNWLGPPTADKGPSETAVASRVADLMTKAEGNDATAEYALAQIYANGIGAPASPTEEHNWLERSAHHGNVQAQYELGIALRDGRGTVQDFDEARRWLQRAAERGNAKAQFALGLMYRAGTGIPIDSVRAYVWFNVAAAQGVPGAAAARDSVLGRLSPAELLEAQAEARRMSGIYIPKAAPAR